MTTPERSGCEGVTKRGLVIETHVVIYCYRCGQCCTDRDGESICFDTAEQAQRYLDDAEAFTGWRLDADGIECLECRLRAECEARGHEPDPAGVCLNCGLECTSCPVTESPLSRQLPR